MFVVSPEIEPDLGIVSVGGPREAAPKESLWRRLKQWLFGSCPGRRLLRRSAVLPATFWEIAKMAKGDPLLYLVKSCFGHFATRSKSASRIQTYSKAVNIKPACSKCMAKCRTALAPLPARHDDGSNRNMVVADILQSHQVWVPGDITSMNSDFAGCRFLLLSMDLLAYLLPDYLQGGIDIKQFVQLQNLDQPGTVGRQPTNGKTSMLFPELVPSIHQYADETGSEVMNLGKIDDQALRSRLVSQVLHQTAHVLKA